MSQAWCTGCPLQGRPHLQANMAGGPQGGVYILGGFPDLGSARNDGNGTAFNGRRSFIVRSIVSKLVEKMPRKSQPRVFYGYACLCNPEYNKGTKRYEISADIIEHCAAYARDFIDLQKPDVILAMGVDAYRALGIRGATKDKRGTVDTFRDRNGREVPVVCTFDISSVNKNPGLVNVFAGDFRKAFNTAAGVNQKIEPTVYTPVTVPDILQKLENLYAGIERSEAKYFPLAFDTETTSLKPHVKEDRIIAMSFSWALHKGLAFPYEHRAAPFTDDERQQIKEAVERLLNHPKVKLLMANGSFDMRYLWARGIKCPPQFWDVLLAEHALDEDKKGEYSLKDVTRDRLPGYANYEEELKEHRASAWKRKAELVKERKAQASEASAQNMLDWWVELPEAGRYELLAKWVKAGYISSLKDTASLAVLKKVKRKGEMVIPKKYTTALAGMLKKVPLSELPEGVLVEADIPDDMLKQSYEDIDIATLLPYAAMDVITTRLIYSQQRAEMDDSDAQDAVLKQKYPNEMRMMRPVREAFTNITMPLSYELAHMQLHGICIDRDKIREYQGILEEKTAEVLDRMYTEVGVRFNPNSTADLVRILYEDLKLPVLNYTESGTPAVDKDSLNNLADAHHDISLLPDLLLYRKLSKTAGTYLKNWLEMSAYDGKLHTDFLQTGTATYRLSSSNPNLQNVPFSLKMGKDESLNLKAIFLPDEGYDIYDLDISNAEMRTVCAYSMDKHLIEAFNSDKDLHCLTGVNVCNGKFTYEELLENKEDKTTEEYVYRQISKRVNFGTIYGIGPDALKSQLWNSMRVAVSVEEAQHYLDQFFVTYPGVKTYMDNTEAFVDRHNFVYTYFGRRRRFPYATYFKGDTNRVHRQAVNARIQSTSSDIVLSCLRRVNQYLRSRNDGSCVLLTVHDSILFQAPHGAHTELKPILDRLIVDATHEQCPWLPVKWKYDVGWGPNYGDTHGKVE